MFQEEDRETGILGRPLDPQLLRKIGVLKDFPPPPSGFRPDGEWSQSYRILGCHGYVDTGNATLGFLKISRIPGDPFQLQIRQRMLHTNSQESLEVDMTCRTNQIASPLNWRLTSRCFDENGNPIDKLGTNHQGSNKSASVTSDFSLMEALQRLPFAPPKSSAFDLLEGMTLLRPAHRLYFDGERRFHHTGPGLLPYEYWLDDNHRLLLAVTCWRAYILDDAAESALPQSRSRTGKKKADL